MDILQHAWGQVILVILLQLLYIEISTVSCFAWVNPTKTRSQNSPAESHIISQRWHQSVPKWYPYNMWKKRKRKASEASHQPQDNVFAKGRFVYGGKVAELVSKYQRLRDKLNRKKLLNNVLSHGSWKNKHQSTVHDDSYPLQYSDPVRSTAKVLEENQYLSSTEKDMFDSDAKFSSSHAEEVTPEAKKEDKISKQSGFMDGFGDGFSNGFGDGGFTPTKPGDGFSDGFLPVAPPANEKPHKADTASIVSTGFEDGQFESGGGSWGDGSWSDSGSWAGDGFGTGQVAGQGNGAWGDVSQGSGGFTSFGEGSFSDDSKDCDTILTKSCSANSECSCYGVYKCSENRCTPIQTADYSASSSLGTWGEVPADFGGFTKRKDPSKLIQVFMLPWQPEK